MKEAYVHYFDRYFTYNNQQIGRLAQIRKYGILSPAEAEKMGLPYVPNVGNKLTILGLDEADYLQVIFLYPYEIAKNLTGGRGDSWVTLDKTLPVITPSEMKQKHNGKWVVLSPGEVYAVGRIDPKFIIN